MDITQPRTSEGRERMCIGIDLDPGGCRVAGIHVSDVEVAPATFAAVELGRPVDLTDSGSVSALLERALRVARVPTSNVSVVVSLTSGLCRSVVVADVGVGWDGVVGVAERTGLGGSGATLCATVSGVGVNGAESVLVTAVPDDVARSVRAVMADFGIDDVVVSYGPGVALCGMQTDEQYEGLVNAFVDVGAGWVSVTVVDACGVVRHHELLGCDALVQCHRDLTGRCGLTSQVAWFSMVAPRDPEGQAGLAVRDGRTEWDVIDAAYTSVAEVVRDSLERSPVRPEGVMVYGKAERLPLRRWLGPTLGRYVSDVTPATHQTSKMFAATGARFVTATGASVGFVPERAAVRSGRNGVLEAAAFCVGGTRP